MGFLPCAQGNIGKEGKTVKLSIKDVELFFFHNLLNASIAQSAEQRSLDRGIPGSNSASGKHFFHHLYFFLLGTASLISKNGRFIRKCYKLYYFF